MARDLPAHCQSGRAKRANNGTWLTCTLPVRKSQESQQWPVTYLHTASQEGPREPTMGRDLPAHCQSGRAKRINNGTWLTCTLPVRKGQESQQWHVTYLHTASQEEPREPITARDLPAHCQSGRAERANNGTWLTCTLPVRKSQESQQWHVTYLHTASQEEPREPIMARDLPAHCQSGRAKRANNGTWHTCTLPVRKSWESQQWHVTYLHTASQEELREPTMTRDLPAHCQSGRAKRANNGTWLTCTLPVRKSRESQQWHVTYLHTASQKEPREPTMARDLPAHCQSGRAERANNGTWLTCTLPVRKGQESQQWHVTYLHTASQEGPREPTMARDLPAHCQSGRAERANNGTWLTCTLPVRKSRESQQWHVTYLHTASQEELREPTMARD